MKNLVITFKKGKGQSQKAYKYFEDASQNFIEMYLPPVEPRAIVFVEDDHDELPIRIWAQKLSFSEKKLVPWLRTALSDIDAFNDWQKNKEKTIRLVKGWMSVHHDTDTFFIEVLSTDNAFSSEEKVRLALGVVGGRLIMFSTQNFMYVKLGDGLHGLSLDAYGSYLFEEQ